jgi:very-short-patch-repair endonuclease
MSKLRNGLFHLPYNPDLVNRAKELRKNMTPAEQKLWFGFLRDFQFRVHRQRPVDNFIVDFYCAALKLVIEVDGDSHFTEDGQAYDQARTQKLEQYGLSILRFTNLDVISNFDAVCQKIQQYSDNYI